MIADILGLLFIGGMFATFVGGLVGMSKVWHDLSQELDEKQRREHP